MIVHQAMYDHLNVQPLLHSGHGTLAACQVINHS